jgi:hypothetical protein
LFCAGAVLAAVHFTRTRTPSALAWAVVLSAFAMSFRPECLLIAPLAGLVILILAPDEFAKSRLWRGAVAGVVGASVPLLHMFAVRNEAWGASDSRMSLQHAVANLPTNLSFYFEDERFPGLFAVAAVAGLLGRTQHRERLLLAVYFLAFWGVFLFFYAGSYNYGADVRYSLMSYVPLAILGGAGLWQIGQRLRRLWLPSWTESGVFAMLAAGVVYYFLPYVPLVRATGEEAWAARADVRYAREFAAALPPNSIVLTHNPSMFHVWNVNAAQLSIATVSPAYVEDQLFSRYAGGVYIHWNFWCNVDDPVQKSFCHQALAMLPNELVAERRERNYRYALYRAHPRSH